MNGIRARVSALIVLGLLMTLIAGCGSSGGSKSAPSPVVERGVGSAGSSEAESDGQSYGVDDEREVDVYSLDDPNSPLAVRVIYFDYDSSDIRADFSDTVAAHARYLEANPGLSVTLEGHADERGSREYNLALGERRALAVRKRLVLLGAAAGQIRTVSYGEERPVAEGHDDSSYGQNRRVELVY
ncbi:MAG: peptidoglycan-associated lipoprotein Pal [Pseudomonadota bacterium]